MAIRYVLTFFIEIVGKLPSLCERANYTAIGFSGHVSVFDEGVAKDRGLKPLNRFERWLLKPIIEAEQGFRRQEFRQAVIEVTGEDPETY
ncbi:MAG: hypothetical protein G01um101420_582 [Parcubacteria group bacterium Gr01-1014_20]|nr:MAG: hypothetical protein G01um101420_582 [Parcubacteria group bacterium Gr01-1014_20]